MYVEHMQGACWVQLQRAAVTKAAATKLYSDCATKFYRILMSGINTAKHAHYVLCLLFYWLKILDLDCYQSL